MSSKTSDSGAAASGFFVDAKKGEVNELKQLLKNINVERDVKRKRDVLKKVIACMTMGIDVSRLFTEMIMAIESKDIVVKKMVYLYLCNYAHKEPEMAIMCINSLRRECDNEDPLVRGLALRSICNLRLESILEYVEEPLRKSLVDLSSYVRKIGVMAVLKLYRLRSTFITDSSSGYMFQLQGLLQDPDATVIANVLYVLNELQLHYGGLEISQQTVMHLLSRIGEFSEWGLCAVLDILSRYSPQNDDEVFAIMNLLDPVLKTANSGAVLGTVKCFMKLANSMSSQAASSNEDTDMLMQVWARSKPPLLTLVAGANPELQYAILKHLELILLLPSAEGVFDDEYRQFFVKYNEAPHIKHLKVDLLPLLANAANARDIIQELNEYVTDVDSQLSKRSLQAIGHIALNGTIGSELSGEIVTQMMRLAMDIDIPYVRSEAIYQCIYVLRIHRHTAQIVIPHIHKLLESNFIEDVKCRSAIIWMIGEYASDIDTSPYLLENIVDDYEEEASNELKLHLLTAVMKTFFARPPETQRTLGKLLKLAVNDMNDMDVHDRGLLYYRLLSNTEEANGDGDIDMDTVAKIFRENTPIDEYNDVQSEKRNDILTNEFNTLAVIYGEHSVIFIEEEYQLKLENAPMKDDTFENLLSPMGGSHNDNTSAVAANAQGSVNLLDDSVDDGQDLLGGDSSTDDNKGSTLSVHAASPFELVRDGITTLSPPEFQKKYGAASALYNGAIVTMNSDEIAAYSCQNIVDTLKSAGLYVVASGNLPASGPAGFKLFAHVLYQIGGDDSLSLLSTSDEQKNMALLIQLVIVKGTGQVTGAVKVSADSQAVSVSDTERAALLEHFLSLVRQILKSD